MRFLGILTAGAVALMGLSVQARAEMVITSADFEEGAVLENAQVFKGFGCEGDNLSPQLSWSGVPEGAKSLALNVYDPDAPTGSGWWHWGVYNIPVDVSALEAGASLSENMPQGAIEITTDYGVPGFGGACPPVGDEPHNYIFTLYALDVEKLELPENASGALLGYNLNAHALEKAKITATYGR
tara:strand:- start:1625 stop:2176 length:552 start_codon:yes stop_codon:yes gene_type:complete